MRLVSRAVAASALIAACGAATSTTAQPLPGRLLAWTPKGLVALNGWSAGAATPVATPAVLVHGLGDIRQLDGGRVVAIAGEPSWDEFLSSPDIEGSRFIGRLVTFMPANPAGVVDLGTATAWFPNADGTGVWRVVRSVPDAGASFQLAELGFDGTPLSPVINLPAGHEPVAATTTGFVVQEPTPPHQAYPPGIKIPPEASNDLLYDSGTPRPTNLVAYDRNAREVRHVEDWARVDLAESHAVARVVNGGGLVPVHATPLVLDLDTSQPVQPDRAELRWETGVDADTTTVGNSVSADTRGLRQITVGPSYDTETAVATDVEPDPNLPVNYDSDVWVDDVVLFPIRRPGAASVAAWSSTTRKVTRAVTLLPDGSYPIAAIT